jgi:hypothetical protein
MRFPIRTLLIWWLALALPAQGVAAATMALCGPNHHGAAQAAPSPRADAEAAHHGSAVQALDPHHAAHDGAGHAGHPGAHHGAPHAEAAQADEGPSSAQAPTKLKPADSHKCSACASCCSAAALPASAPAVAEPEHGATVFATLEPSVEPFAADGPDRPPRTILA